MKPKICAVITGNNLKEFLQNLEKAQRLSQMIELRVDHIQDLKIQDVKTIKNKTKRQSIFTCRRQEEGGKFRGTENERRKILLKAIELDFDSIDIELTTLNHFNVSCLPAGKVKHHNKKIIISYHNFKETPSENVLTLLITQMQIYKPFAIKIATQVNHDHDIIRLCKLIVNKSMDEKRIIIGMGKKGKMLRVIGPLIGNYLTYASMDNQSSTLGQYSIAELQSIYKLLNLINN